MTDVRGGSIWLEGVQQPAFSPDGVHFAFMDPAYTYEHQFDANFKLVVENLELRLPSRRLVSFPAATGFQVRNRLESYSWSADSSMVMIFLDERSNYYEKSAGYHTFLFLLDSGILLEYERLIGDAPRMAWASDSRRILFAITKIEPDGSYSIRLNLLEPFTRINQGYGLIPELTSQEYVFIDRMVWLP